MQSLEVLGTRERNRENSEILDEGRNRGEFGGVRKKREVGGRKESRSLEIVEER